MNNQLLLLVNGWAGQSKPLDDLMVFCASWLIFVLFAVAAGFGLLLAKRREWRPLGYFIATMVVAFLVLQLAGHVYVDQRPFVTQHLHQLVAHAAGSSFPSDHTTAATAMAPGLMCFTCFKQTGLLLLGSAILIGFARIFVGIHWPIDILGGLITGLVGVLVVYASKLVLSHRAVRRQA